MKLELRNNKDFWAGSMFFGAGVGAMIVARHYPSGTALNMGPGYFPMVLSGLLIIFGLAIMLSGLRKGVLIARDLVVPIALQDLPTIKNHY